MKSLIVFFQLEYSNDGRASGAAARKDAVESSRRDRLIPDRSDARSERRRVDRARRRRPSFLFATRGPHARARARTQLVGRSVGRPIAKIPAHRDLASFITDASARSLIRRALRATRSLADARTRESAVEEVKRTVRATPRTSGKEATAKAMSEARRRLREFEEIILMAR